MMKHGAPADPAVLERLRVALGHRGPDGSGVLCRGDVGLVHTRLAIVDLVTGDQPLCNAAGVAAIANGEIYNAPELRAALPDWPFRTASDCEPILPLYERDGVDFCRDLRGMYAIALHDPTAGRLVLARDPFGIKPLYYAETEACFAFASEAEALVAAGLVPVAEDAAKRDELLQLKYTTGTATIFPGIHRVLPGETLTIAAGAIAARQHRPALPAELAHFESLLQSMMAIEREDRVPNAGALLEMLRDHQPDHFDLGSLEAVRAG